jgi:hypothetical protein
VPVALAKIVFHIAIAFITPKPIHQARWDSQAARYHLAWNGKQTAESSTAKETFLGN